MNRFYSGVSLGYGQSEVGGFEADSFSYGGHLGYDRDFGTLVVGGELENMGTTQEYAGQQGSSVGPLYSAKLRFGADLGRSMIYAVGGYGAG